MNTQKQELQAHIHKIFPSVKTEEQLLDLLNEIHKQMSAGNFTNQKSPTIIPLKILKYYKNIKVSRRKRYKSFTIKKKSGKTRKISAPAPGLKQIQQCLNEIFQAYYTPNEHACGFIPNRNVTDGAKMHTNQPYVYNIDLKDFFDTITFPRIKKVLSLPPFNLRDEREPLGYVITSLCCHPKIITIDGQDGIKKNEVRNCLPQGAPTSPILTNIVCRNLDRHLAGLARRFKARYSRYADDITFSCNYNIFKQNSDFLIELNRIIEEEQGLVINQEKTRLQLSRQCQEVTGLVVNQKVNVTQKYVKQIRLWLHYWECFGLDRAQQYFIQQYIKERGHVKSHTAHIENVIGGKLDYMRMVVGDTNPAYKKLKARYDSLTGVKEDTSKREKNRNIVNINVKQNSDDAKVSKTATLDIENDNLLSLLDELINNI